MYSATLDPTRVCCFVPPLLGHFSTLSPLIGLLLAFNLGILDSNVFRGLSSVTGTTTSIDLKNTVLVLIEYWRPLAFYGSHYSFVHLE